MRLGKSKTCIRVAAPLAVFAGILLCGVMGHAEAGKASLAGTILDPSGHSIPGARLTLIDAVTGISRTVVSSRSGLYKLPDLPVGTYHLKVSFPGGLRRTPRMSRWTRTNRGTWT